MSSDADLLFGGKKPSPVESKPDVKQGAVKSIDKSVDQPVDQSTNQSITQPIKTPKKAPTENRSSKPVSQPLSQSTSQSVSRLASQPADNSIVDRPKAFYILKRIDRKIDDAVRYLQDKRGIKKVDRSVIVNAYLDKDDLWTDEALDQLYDRVISQLTSRLTGQ